MCARQDDTDVQARMRGQVLGQFQIRQQLRRIH